MHKEFALTDAMVDYCAGEPGLVHHFLKVYGFARQIGLGEALDGGTMEILGAAAIVHDIGIVNANKKYGRSDGKLQELEGPPEAETLLRAAGYGDAAVQRVCYLVGHHHTYTDMDGLDYQILVEADFLVNLHDGKKDEAAVRAAYKKVFRTAHGKRLCRAMFGISD